MTIDQAMHLARQHQQAGRQAAADDICRQVIAGIPDDGAIHSDLSKYLCDLGRIDLAISHARRAIALTPNFAMAHYNLGVALNASGQLDNAIAAFTRTVELSPDFAPGFNNLGAALTARGKPDHAIAALSQAVALQPDYVRAFNNLALALTAARRFDEAISAYTRSIELQPDSFEIQNNLAVALGHRGRLDQAVAGFRRALQIKPDLADAHFNLGNALKDLGRFEEAIACYQRALELRPDWPGPLNNLAPLLRRLGRHEEAMAAHQRALEIQPDMPENLCNMAVALSDRLQLDEALQWLERAIQLKPDYAQAHFNIGQILLLKGDFDRGWEEYEWRWKIPAEFRPRNFAQPTWDGSDLHGRTIFLTAEQALGDAIQFVRYAALVADRGGRVILECHPDLVNLLAACPGVAQAVPMAQPPPDFDLHIPLLSMPRIFRTELNSIPAHLPYVSADPEQSQAWARRLAASGDRPRIGLVWAGRPNNDHDRNRSIPLAQFAPLAPLDHLHFYSLQKGEAAGQIRPLGLDLTDWTADLHDFSRTAALIENLDLIVTIDTSVAHLAGAMGKPTWVLLPFIADFRWLLDREDSPWYPTMRLFRQPSLGDWSGAIDRLAAELSARFA